MADAFVLIGNSLAATMPLLPLSQRRHLSQSRFLLCLDCPDERSFAFPTASASFVLPQSNPDFAA
jgi:hypothetical protein